MSKIVIEMVFSEELAKTAAKAMENGEIVDADDLLFRLADVYAQTIKKNKEFMKPLKLLDKNVKVNVAVC